MCRERRDESKCWARTSAALSARCPRYIYSLGKRTYDKTGPSDWDDGNDMRITPVRSMKTLTSMIGLTVWLPRRSGSGYRPNEQILRKEKHQIPAPAMAEEEARRECA
jgi:hypothetical protein